MNTDDSMVDLIWPDLGQVEPQYQSKIAFQSYLQLHRRELDNLNPGVFEEMAFYTTSIKRMINWLYDALSESKYTSLWKSLVAYQNIIECKELAGVERGIGTYFFSHGGFDDRFQYREYTKQVNLFRKRYNRAMIYSKLVKPIENYDIIVEGRNLHGIINEYRTKIEHRNISGKNLDLAIDYFDKMSMYMDKLFLLQREIETYLVDTLDDLADERLIPVIISSIILIVTLSKYNGH